MHHICGGACAAAIVIVDCFADRGDDGLDGGVLVASTCAARRMGCGACATPTSSPKAKWSRWRAYVAPPTIRSCALSATATLPGCPRDDIFKLHVVLPWSFSPCQAT